MGNFIKLSAVFIVLGLFTFCKGSEKASEPAVNETAMHAEKNVIVDPEFSAKGKNTRADVTELNRVSKGIIEVIFNYSGGCEEHEFYLATQGGMIKTLPPKLELFLVDKQEDDPCRMLITDTINFNIEAILPERVDSVVISINNNYSKMILR